MFLDGLPLSELMSSHRDLMAYIISITARLSTTQGRLHQETRGASEGITCFGE